MALIDLATRRRLLDLARSALSARVQREPAPLPAIDMEIPASGVFVTIYHRGQLRGCLGTLDPREPAAETIVRLAGDVTFRDGRFAPVGPHEIVDVTIDISLLTDPVLVHDFSEIIIGRHGLIVEHGRARGLLLPQVAPEHGFDCDTFLAHTCIKAGLAPDAWMNGATVYRFEAEVFGD